MKITLVGIGIQAGDLSLKGYQAIKNGQRVLLRTALSVAGKSVLELDEKIEPLDYIYQKSKNFDTLSKNLAKSVLDASKNQDVVYLVDGNVTDDVSCSIILRKRKNVEVIAGVSKADYLFSQIGVSGGFSACSAYDIKNFSFSLPLAVYDVDNQFVASEVKLALADRFGDEIPVYKFKNGSFSKMKLYEFDFENDFDYSSAIVVDKLDLIQKTRFDFDDLHTIVSVLRSENGCPWDRAQTKESIRKDILEEAYELVDTINRNDEDGMLEESGDLILQSVFSSMFAEERNSFTVRDVLSGICSKLIQRHTHIFGADKASSAENALDIWEKNKQKEKGFENGGEYLDSVPKNFPALMRAQKVGSRAKKYNMDFEDALAVFDKVTEELLEVKECLDKNDISHLAEELGDLLFAVVSLARLSGLESEEILNLSTEKFIQRFKKAERLILNDGKNMKELSPKEIDDYYNATKRN
ncbi:MAG: nucleoside triphosphate pyrophosphohydrolase [Clostridia bacterium]|nr:nucleoside triphosphate pyrophosphohydrolase [Clostridia bacterium]